MTANQESTNGDRRPIRTASSAALPPGFRSRLLEGLRPSEITSVLAAAKRRKVSPNQVLQHEGVQARRLCMLETGRAAFYKIAWEGNQLFLRWILPGDAFGLSALQRQAYLTTVRALQQGRVLVWERVSLHALFSQIPRLRENVVGVASDYMASLLDLLVARTSRSAQQRIAQALVESAERAGQPEREGIELALTHEQLAEMADVSLFTACRQLSEWQSQGILTKSRKKIVIRAPERLSSPPQQK